MGNLDDVRVAGWAQLTHRDRYGRIIDRWTEKNTIVNNGLDAFLKARLKGTAAVSISTWNIGLIGGKTSNITISATDLGDSTGLGWSESTLYSNAARPKWTPGAVANQTISSTSAAATFNINASATVGGMFLISTSAKGNIGTSNEAGDLHSAIKFSQTRSMSSGDTLDVKYTNTMTFSTT